MKGLILTAALLVAGSSAYAESCKVEVETGSCRRCNDELHEKVPNRRNGSLR